ncbi:MAG: tail protein X [Eubacterium sp.]|nr:tail protein X [Eubacterium sp.]
MDRITDYYEYETRQGDTFDELALQFYDNELLAHLIIDFNPQYSDYLIFDEGINLRIPIYETKQSVETLPPWKQETKE